MDFEGHPLKASVVQVYASAAENSEGDTTEFYNSLEEAISFTDVTIIIGGWKANIGDNNHEMEEVRENYWHGERCARGDHL